MAKSIIDQYVLRLCSHDLLMVASYTQNAPPGKPMSNRAQKLRKSLPLGSLAWENAYSKIYKLHDFQYNIIYNKKNPESTHNFPK